MNRASESIILVGAGGHSRSCIDVIEQEGRFSIAGLVGQPHEIGAVVMQYPVLGADSDLPGCIGMAHNALVAVGQIGPPAQRIRLFELLRELGYKMPAIVSPFAYVSRHAEIGEGSIVMHGATINAGAKVGANCIVNSRALIEHDANVGNHCHVATGAVLNGGVRVGEGSFIGSGCVVKEGVSLGVRCLVGMGLSVRHDQSDFAHVTADA